MDRIRPGETAEALRRQLRNWYWVGPLTWAVMLSPAKRWLEHSSFAGRTIQLRFRDGRTALSSIRDMAAYVEVFLLRDYDIDGLPWADIETVVDAGANAGMATMWFAENCPRARIVAVEPGAAAGDRLRRNLVNNRLSGRVTILPIALGGKTGKAHLDERGPSVMHRLADSAGGGREVDVSSLDHLLRTCAIDALDILKVDCEGSEYDILLSADLEVLQKVRVIVGEWHPSPRYGPDDLAGRLEDAGFAVTMRPHPTLEGFGNFAAVRHQP